MNAVTAIRACRKHFSSPTPKKRYLSSNESDRNMLHARYHWIRDESFTELWHVSRTVADTCPTLIALDKVTRRINGDCENLALSQRVLRYKTLPTLNMT